MKKYWKSQGKVRDFCQRKKVGTLILARGVPWLGGGYPGRAWSGGGEYPVRTT